MDLILQQDLPEREIFAAHVAAGAITSLCTCGCHGFGFEVPVAAELKPLQRSSGLFCEVAFSSNEEEEIDILIFTDERGYFAGADVSYGMANVGPMPDSAEPVKLLGVWPGGSATEV
ncbi:hypothetical protein LZ009_06635 [Ramlibacter sp. XY19]|uniref:hypothetical protein n=1 Tax=Ramlibacter paludis TaxID=2908000 RepID=UPI0023DB6D0E|nr:hypothetical protein [Ramlibacter paludis]MCG2592457.1 hypothetical protein [Ramlibacter paludis]